MAIQAFGPPLWCATKNSGRAKITLFESITKGIDVYKQRTMHDSDNKIFRQLQLSTSTKRPNWMLQQNCLTSRWVRQRWPWQHGTYLNTHTHTLKNCVLLTKLGLRLYLYRRQRQKHRCKINWQRSGRKLSGLTHKTINHSEHEQTRMNYIPKRHL